MDALADLLGKVARRERLAQAARWASRGAWAAGVAAFFWLALCRLAGLAPAPKLSILCAFVFIVGAGLGLMRWWSARGTAIDTARKIDDFASAKELFLSAVLARGGDGDFGEIVHRRAVERAGEIPPSRVVPWPWSRPALRLGLMMACLAAAFFLLPQRDPFGRGERRALAESRSEKLTQTKKITELRTAQVAVLAREEKAQVQEALARLSTTLQKARPQEKETALRELTNRQKELGELWRKLKSAEFSTALEKSAQSFGQIDAAKISELRESLKKGETSALTRELSALQKELRKLANTADSAEKRSRQDALARRLRDLAQAMQGSATSPEWAAALARAAEQVALAQQGALSKEGLQAAADSVQLSAEEVAQLARNLQDAESLEKALAELQAAKQLAAKGQLDGSENPGAAGSDAEARLAAYAKLFQDKIDEAKTHGAGAGMGEKSGMGPGIGNGAKRPEDDSKPSGFKSEKESLALSGGKMLLEWKTKEVGVSGERAAAVESGIRQVQQGVSEAIQQEQVPPGYHEIIRRYFDSLPAAK